MTDVTPQACGILIDETASSLSVLYPKSTDQDTVIDRHCPNIFEPDYQGVPIRRNLFHDKYRLLILVFKQETLPFTNHVALDTAVAPTFTHTAIHDMESFFLGSSIHLPHAMWPWWISP